MRVYVFASTVSDVERALDAKSDHGPLNAQFSTPSILFEGSHPVEAAKAVADQYPDHPVFTCHEKVFFHFFDENKKHIPGSPEPEYPDNME